MKEKRESCKNTRAGQTVNQQKVLLFTAVTRTYQILGFSFALRWMFNTRWSWRSRRKWSDFVIHRVNSPKKHLKHLRLQECRCIIKSVWYFFPRTFPYYFHFIFGNQITMLSIIDYTECSLKVIFRFYFYNHKITSTEVP